MPSAREQHRARFCSAHSRLGSSVYSGRRSTGRRRRFIAGPRNKNDVDLYEAQVPFVHVPIVATYLPAILAETSSTLDLKASFYQVPLPIGAGFFSIYTPV